MKKINNKRTKVNKSEVMTWAHKFFALKGKGMFAWSWAQCLAHAWRQVIKMCEQRYLDIARAAVKVTTWVPTPSEVNGVTAFYQTNEYKGD